MFATETTTRDEFASFIERLKQNMPPEDQKLNKQDLAQQGLIQALEERLPDIESEIAVSSLSSFASI